MATRTSRRSASTRPVEPTPEASPSPEEVAPEATAEEAPTSADDLSGLTQEELIAKVAELQAALAKPVRKPREVRPTPKQVKFLEALRETPDATIGSLCTAAGATETSHGFVFRMIEHGFLSMAVSDSAAKYLPPVETAEGDK